MSCETDVEVVVTGVQRTSIQSGRRGELSVVSAVDLLDLEPVVFKLLHPELGAEGLRLAEADHGVGLYRCFLKLCVLYPRVSIVPTRAIDQVWHAHMLDTAKYRADCQLAFGRFVDHFPYAGLRGQDDRLAWLADFARTRALFREHFGLEIGTEAAASACRNHGDGSDCCVGCITESAKMVRPRPDRAVADVAGTADAEFGAGDG
jgi:hypothetical protein